MIQRYELLELTRCGEPWREMSADDDGDYVLYSDHEQAMKEKDKLLKTLTSLAVSMDKDYEERFPAMKAERDILAEVVSVKSNAFEKQIAALQMYKDSTLGKESERERQIVALTAEVSDLQHILFASEPPYYTKWKEQAEEVTILKDDLSKPPQERCSCAGCSLPSRQHLQTEEIKRLKSILKLIINDLPLKRDWLDPTLETIAKDALKQEEEKDE